MRRTITLVLALLAMNGIMAQAPAFPGAEGHGRYVTGGRGGTVIHVTNLNDSGPGSLREAVSGNDKKIIVFDVGGVIPLSRDLSIGNNTTIEGQTAPSPGITIRYYTVNPGSNNIIRFIRARRGQEKNINDGADAITTQHKTGLIIDHCSFSWSIDEVASFYDNNNFTMQWCTIAESLVNAGHDKGAHGYGGIWGGKLASFHHNLIAHVANRSPRFNGARYNWQGYTGNMLYDQYRWENTLQAEVVDFRNCVIYNCGNGCYGGPGGGYVNIVNNYYKTGPAATTSHVTNVTLAGSGNAGNDQTFWDMTSRYYISGNQVNANANYDWKGVSYDSGIPSKNGIYYTKDPHHYYGSIAGHVAIDGTDCLTIKVEEESAKGEVSTHSASQAYQKVLSYAGASMYPDDVDQRYVAETRNGTATYRGSVTGKKGRIDLVSDVNGYTEMDFGTGAYPDNWDTDSDGMPDIWEKANGLNPTLASDAQSYSLDPKGYYTNIEVYCNALVEDMVKQQNAEAQSAIDEYYPTVEKVEGVPYYGADVHFGEITEGPKSYTISQSTYQSGGNSTVWTFTGDITVSNTKNKLYDNSKGREDGIKYSKDVQYVIGLPDNYRVESATFKGYDNYSETDSYLKELNGTAYDDTEYVYPKKQGDQYSLVAHTIYLDQPATGTLTFTAGGQQTVWVITLNGTMVTSEALTLLGDANIDGVVNVSDIMCIVNHILGSEVKVFNATNADINKDHDINVSDVMGIVNIILNQ